MEIETQRETPLAATAPLDTRGVTQSSLLQRSQVLALAAGLFAALCGIAVLIGWILDIRMLRSVLGDGLPVQPLTAVSISVLGICLVLSIRAPHQQESANLRWQTMVASAGGLLIAAVGLMMLVNHFLDLQLPIQSLLYARDLNGLAMPQAGRVSPATAFCLALTGTGIVLMNVRSRAAQRISQILALIATIVAFAALLGYLYGMPVLVRDPLRTPMAIHSAIALIVIGIGMVLARPGEGFMAAVMCDLDGGVMARRMLPFAIAIPTVLGWITLSGWRADWYHSASGTGILAAANALVFAVTVVLAARFLNRIDSVRRDAEALSSGQKQVLEMIARGAPLHETLDTLVRHVEEQSPDMACSILLLDADTGQLHHGAAPRLPRVYIDAIDGSTIGPCAGSCGTAAYRGEPVFVADIATDPLWENYKHLALVHGLRACWSTPILDADRHVLGTFAIYYKRPALPRKEHLKIVDMATHTAAICISRHRAEKGLRESESRFRQLTESLAQLVWTWLPDGPCDYLGRQWVEYTGIPAERQLGFRWLEQVHPADREPTLEAFRTAVANGTEMRVEHRIRRHDGIYRWFDTRAVRLLDQAGRVVKWFGSATDITERKQTEDVRIRTQKIEAMGTLAGGIAHDFNNILLAIDGHTKQLADELPPHHPARESVTGIAQATARAADLVRRILSFSRQQESKLEPLRLRPVIEEALTLVRATLPAMIEIRTNFGDDIPLVSADATQIHQIIVNLATNAAYAIGDKGGCIDVKLDTLNMDAEQADAIRDLRPGRYVRLTVADNGHGMDRATLSRIFDPFFTTKPAGKGTGLGLSIVHGIMKRSHGAVNVYSEPDKGTSFQLYFPVAANKSIARPHQPAPMETAHGERILYVDDEETLVRLAQRALTRLGYSVTSHTDPSAALDDFRRRPREFDVVITDVSMPGMSGFDLARELLALRSDLPVLMTSGYVKREDEQMALRLGVREIILKPNTLDELGKALNRIFGRQAVDKAS
jgi:PAS domain S-box-containing protein